MGEESCRIAVLGGDVRFLHLASMLAKDGFSVTAGATARQGNVPEEAVTLADTAREALAGAQVAVLPLPVLGGDGRLNAPFAQGKTDAYALLAQMPRDCLVAAGIAPPDYGLAAARHNLRLVDYYAREEFAVSNCVPTAEGAIAIALQELPVTLQGAKVLVIGYGRVGKVLAHRLSALGADVTVSARKKGDLAWIRAFGLKPAETGDLRGLLPAQLVVFNSVPWPVLGWEELALMRPDCLYVELASAPGGLDAQAAAYTHVKVVNAPGLPGRAAPVSAAAILRDTLYNILREQGVPGLPAGIA